MPRCVHCGDFVLVHPEALRERPEVFRGYCLKNPAGHEYVHNYVAIVEVVPTNRVPATISDVDEPMIEPGATQTITVQSTLAPFLDPRGLFFGLASRSLPDLVICAIAIGADRELVFPSPEPSADEVAKRTYVGELHLRRILPGEKVRVTLRNDGAAAVPVRLSVAGTTALFRDTR
jgi:hypothetical protein